MRDFLPSGRAARAVDAAPPRVIETLPVTSLASWEREARPLRRALAACSPAAI
jgi:hypothetical protein